MNQKTQGLDLPLHSKGQPISETGEGLLGPRDRVDLGMVVLVGSQATLCERLCCPFSVLLLPHFPCLTLREMASSGIYKLDNGKSYLNNCFPAKNLLRMPDEGQLTSQIDTFASHSAPTSIFSLSSPFITGPCTTQPHPFPSIFPQQSQGAFKSAC